MDFTKIWTFVLLFSVLISLILSEERIVQTSYGKVRGKINEFNNKKFSAFYGIPYAAPPVGNLRFRTAQKHEGWGDSVRDALEYGPICPQETGLFEGLEGFPKRIGRSDVDEDCLFLDVFVPGDIADVDKGSLPVIVFIHGGAMIIGYSSFQTPEVFVTEPQRVVMVTIQYRLGVLGFLTSGDELIPGNNGLKDQNFALRWVQENIAEFGGDPNRVTITGESAGGESVLAQMVSPMSAGLFRKACAQSPPAAWIYPQKEELSGYFKDYTKFFDCEGDRTEAAIECLKTKSWEEILNITTGKEPTYSQRVIDGEFIKDEPRNLWANGQYNDAEFMIGYTRDDGRLLLDYMVAPGFNYSSNGTRDLEFVDTVHDILLSLQLADTKDWTDFSTIKRYGKFLTNKQELKTILRSVCYETGTTRNDKFRRFLDCLRDGFFGVFSMHAANSMAKNDDPVYAYVFDHLSEQFDRNGAGKVVLGAPHGMDMQYQFGYGISDTDVLTLTDEEKALSRSVIHAWKSFASGEPSYLTMYGDKVKWSKYTKEEPNVLTFDIDMSSDSVAVDEDWHLAHEFWLAIEQLTDWGDREELPDDAGQNDKEEL